MEANTLIFWGVSSLFFVAAILVILQPIFRQSKNGINADIDQRSLNIDIAKEQLADLEASYKKNEISKEEYEELKYELESCLMEDIATDSKQDEIESTNNSSVNLQAKTLKPTILLVVLFIPIFASAFYQYVGKPDMLNGANSMASAQGQSAEQPSVDQMLAVLIDKLKKNPDDEKGWFLLARTFMALKKYDDAYKVYEKMLTIKGESADILVSMADALAMTKGGKVSGEPEKLINRALAIEPENVTALWLAGIAAKENLKNPEAINYFKKLLPLLAAEPESAESVRNMITQLGGKVDTVAAKPSKPIAVDEISNTDIASKKIQVQVTIDEKILSSVNPDLFVFIYAKATQGPPMPLAVYKKQVRDFQQGAINVVLDDSMAMMPTMKLSSFDSVKVGARVSLSGSPMKRSGDYMSSETIVNENTNSIISIVIDKQLN